MSSVGSEPSRGSGDFGDPHEISTPEISIITPCFNAVRHLRDAIESVAGQRGVRVEHIVVDAGSKDGTLEILSQFPAVRWISEPDRGQSDAFNKGLALARGPLIGWLNADDVYANPGALARVVQCFREQPAAVLVGNGHLVRVDPTGKAASNSCRPAPTDSGCGISGSNGTGSIILRPSIASACSRKLAPSISRCTTRWTTTFICGQRNGMSFTTSTC